MSQVITLYTNNPSLNSNILYFDSVPVTTLQAGASVSGFGIPTGAFIATFTDTTITISEINTYTSAGAVITITMNAGAVSKYSSDYKIKVPPGGKITLDTSDDTNPGLVFITGNLNVQGVTTSINTENMQIEDNIIVLNKGELGSDVTLDVSGIEIDRGTNSYGNAQFLWDETVSWFDPVTGGDRPGVWAFRTKVSNRVNGILTNSIEITGDKLSLINRGTGVITVSGTVNYEEQIINYNSTLQARDDDYIPNIKAVIDKIDYQILNAPSDKIRRDDTQVIVYDNNITGRITWFTTSGIVTNQVNVFHFLTTNRELNVTVGSYVTIVNSGNSTLNGTWQVTAADPLLYTFTILLSSTISLSNFTNVATGVYVNSVKSNAKIIIDNQLVGEFQNTHADIFNVRIQDTTIHTTSSNTDLILASAGTGSVRIQDSMKIMYTGYATSATPAMELDCVKLYTDPEGAGDTGIYFVNPTYLPDKADYRRDELISKKKAIAFAILM